MNVCFLGRWNDHGGKMYRESLTKSLTPVYRSGLFFTRLPKAD
jgi:hypothetical protein